jgi:serine/threonine protein kinase/tetratricopeptide (TPR) repeat protein
MLPEKLSHYLVLEKIGAGGMGVVYRAHDELLDRDVALKVLPARSLEDGRTRQRFHREALALAKLNHPNIGSVYEFGSEGGVDFLVMELITGVSLDAKFVAGPMNEREILRLGAQVADGLEAAHRQGIIHRDLKPTNIRLTEDNRVKILDFGIAHWIAPQADTNDATVTLTSPNEIVGTLAYMAPEQLRGQKADARTDIYSTGVVLYEMSTGKRPFSDVSGPQLISAILEQPTMAPTSRNASVSPALESIILKAIDKDPDRRYQSAQELRIDLERLSSGSAGTAAFRPRPRPVWPLIAAAGILLLIAGAGWHNWRRETRPATPGMAANHSARKSVAVVGFKNLSGNADEAWLSTALSEMLTTELAAGEQLRMIPGENVARMKHDLSLPEADSFGNETLRRIRSLVGSDLVVLGSYLETGGKLRLDVRMQDTQSGETVASFSESSDAGQLLDLVSRAGAEAREKLAVTGITAADRSEVRAALPSSNDAARLYAEGVDKLRHFEFPAARDLLQKAVAVDSSNAPAHSALAAAWAALGYDSKARDEARTAFELSAGLPRESRLVVEGRYYEATRDWARALDTYRTLWNLFPDNLDYGLRLATVLISANQPKEALTTLDQLRKLPAPEGADPRIDLVEARAADSLSDFHLEEQSAGRAVQKAQAVGAQQLAAQALGNQGWALDRLGSIEPATAAIEQAHALFESAGDRGGAAHALQIKGNLLYDRGDFTGARAAFEQALKVFQEIGAKHGEAETLGSLGNVQYDNGQLDDARRYYEQSLALQRELGSKGGVAGALGNLANVLDSMGDLKGARLRQAEALQAFREAHDRRGEASTLNNLGNVMSELGDLRGAKERYEQSMAVQDEIGYRRGRGFSLQSISDILREQDNLEDARKMAQEGADLRRELGDQNNLASSEAQIAQLALDQGQYSAVEELARPAVETFQKIKSTQGEAVSQALIALAQIQLGKPADAAATAERAVALAGQGTDRLPRFMTAIVAARAQAANGQAPEAVRALQSVINESSKYGYLSVEFEARLAMGEIETRRNLDGGRAQLRGLAKAAKEKGFLRIERLAQTAESDR